MLESHVKWLWKTEKSFVIKLVLMNKNKRQLYEERACIFTSLRIFFSGKYQAFVNNNIKKQKYFSKAISCLRLFDQDCKWCGKLTRKSKQKRDCDFVHPSRGLIFGDLG